VSSNNSNWPLLDDKSINAAMDKAKLIVDTDERNQAWGKIDQDIMAQAPAIPYLWDTQPGVSSKNVNLVINRFNTTVDLSFTSLKNP